MVYRNYHCEQNDQCLDDSCTSLTAYVRIDGKWKKIGYYGSLCKLFSPIDLEKEKQNRLQKEKLATIKSQIQQTKQEGKTNRKIIENEFDMTTSFFREQSKSK